MATVIGPTPPGTGANACATDSTLAPEQLEDAEGRGWNEGWVTLGEAAGVVGMETVDIFMWWDLLEGPVRVEAIGERHLDEDAIDRGIGGQGLDPLVQLSLRDVVQVGDR